MKYFDKEYEAAAIAAGYEDLLRYTQLYICKESSKLIKNKPLPKAQNKLRQQKKLPYRTSNITENTRSKIMMMSFNMMSCREISKRLREDYNINIHYSTVNKIINGKYKPKLKK